MRELRVLSPTAILGYGFPARSFELGISKKPDLIAVDAGSTDPGPYYLGSGKSFTQRAAVKRDLVFMIKAAQQLDIPLIVGSAGGSGAKPHVQWNLEIIKEIMAETGIHLPMAVIDSDIPKSAVLQKLEEGSISPCGPVAELTKEDIAATTNLVAQMGVEPFIEALNRGAQLILAGRAYDPASFACMGINQGFDPGLALHMGKILECAAIAATPGSGSDCMLGYLREKSFILETLNEKRKCTKVSVAAHTLYEKSNPYQLPGPGGRLDLTNTSFTELGDGRVEVTGTKFVPTDQYFIKLEGAKKIGSRTISIAGIRDPIMIGQIDEILHEVKEIVEEAFASKGAYTLNFHCYGKNGVMGELEPVITEPIEIGLVIDVVANDQETANTVCGFTRSTLLHYGYDGRKSTAGNLAFPYSPSDFRGGDVFAFSVHHLMMVKSPLEHFSIRMDGEF